MKNQNLLHTLQEELNTATKQNSKLSIIASYAKKTTQAQRCSIFIYHKASDQLRSIYADGIKGTMALKSNIGIVGYTFHKKTTVVENNTSSSTLFFNAVDKKTQFSTETILAVPLLHDNKRVGVIELLNKEAGFNDEDRVFLESLATVLIDTLLHKQSKTPVTTPEVPETTAVDSYLDDKKLYLMDNGSAYYKILNMKRDYFIAADICYQLTETAQKISLSYYGMEKEFLTIEMLVKIELPIQGLLLSKETNYTSYPLEEEE